MDKEGYDGFYGKIWEVSESSVITVDKRVMMANDFKKGDNVKVWIKLVKKKEE